MRSDPTFPPAHLSTPTGGKHTLNLRLVGLAFFASGVAVGMGAHAVADGHQSRPVPVCAAEDSIPLIVADQAFGWEEGQPVCVHVDSIKETGR